MSVCKHCAEAMDLSLRGAFHTVGFEENTVGNYTGGHIKTED